MKTRLLIVIGIVIASIGIGTSAYVINVQSQCESLLGDTHYPRPLTFWNCLDYLEIFEDDESQSPLDCRMKYGKVYPDVQICLDNLPAGITSPHIKSKSIPELELGDEN